jgi:hypothetical protein
MKCTIKKLLIVAMASAAFAGVVSGQQTPTHEWNTTACSSTGNWSDTNCWVGGYVPNGFDTIVQIDGDVLVALNMDTNVGELQLLGGALLEVYDSIATRTLTIDTPIAPVRVSHGEVPKVVVRHHERAVRHPQALEDPARHELALPGVLQLHASGGTCLTGDIRARGEVVPPHAVVPDEHDASPSSADIFDDRLRTFVVGGERLQPVDEPTRERAAGLGTLREERGITISHEGSVNTPRHGTVDFDRLL